MILDTNKAVVFKGKKSILKNTLDIIIVFTRERGTF